MRFLWNAVCSFSRITWESGVKGLCCHYPLKKKNKRVHASFWHKCNTYTHFPSSGSHGRVSGMLKSPSCVYRRCIALICRIQALQSQPHLHLSLHALQVLLLVKPNADLHWPWLSQQAGSDPATLADPANMWSTWAWQTLHSQVWWWNDGNEGKEEKEDMRLAQKLNLLKFLISAVKT